MMPLSFGSEGTKYRLARVNGKEALSRHLKGLQQAHRLNAAIRKMSTGENSFSGLRLGSDGLFERHGHRLAPTAGSLTSHGLSAVFVTAFLFDVKMIYVS